MKKMYGLTALLLALALLLSSCAGSTTATVVSTEASTGASTAAHTTAKTTAATAKPKPWEIDENVNFRGETFTFALLTDYENVKGLGICDIGGETEGTYASNVNEYARERNEYIYETFNGKTEMVKMSAASLASELEAGKCKVDFVYAPHGAVNTGYCYDVESIGIDLTLPWWNAAITRISEGGKNYAIAACFNVETYYSLEAIFFNKDVKEKIPSLKDRDFYELVYENKWTIDKLIEISRLAYSEADVCGFFTEKNAVSALYFASGQSFISETVNGGETTFVNGFNDTAKAVTDKLIDVFGDASVKTGEGAEIPDALMNGKALFIKAKICDMAGFAEEYLNCGVMPLPCTVKNGEFPGGLLSADAPFIFALKSGASPKYMRYYLWYTSHFSGGTIYRDFLNLHKYQYTTDTDSATMVDMCINFPVVYDAACRGGWADAEEKYITAVLAGENPVEKFRTELYPQLEAKARE